MKNLTLLFGFLIFFYLPMHGQNRPGEITIDILAQPTSDMMPIEHAVEVTHNENRYTCWFNIKHGNKIETHRAHVESEKTFDKVSYTWISKNKLALKLFSSATSIEFNFKVWSDSKSSTSMEVDPAEWAKS